VTVPAGTFQAFTIEDTWEYPEGLPIGKVHSILRAVTELGDTAQQAFRRTYADGIGMILWVYGSRTDRLVSFRTVAVEPSTWSRIRMLYR
jgi:hypothetical protein